MAPKKKQPSLEAWPLGKLRAFPLQADYFDDLSDHDLKGLADDIKENGLDLAIEILSKNKAGYPPGTIIRGHQRKRALMLNGATETKVKVRYDLADADAATIEDCFLEDNFTRRQLDPLAKARVALRRFEIERGREPGQLSPWEETEARERVGKAIGMSGRNLARYFAVLRTPVEVQDAFRDGKLPLTTASRVAGLSPTEQDEIAKQIRAGKNPKTVVAKYLPESDGRHVRTGDALASFAKALQRGVQDLNGRVERLQPRHVEEHLTVIKRARKLLRNLVGIVEGDK